MQNVSDKLLDYLHGFILVWIYTSEILVNHPIDNKKVNVYEAGGLELM